jgi:predicted pyridoxine 5'-phosphate oxidase superfamily flavin-nucleotide-binding protein
MTSTATLAAPGLGPAAFHPGERAVQRRMGVEQRMAEIGPRVIRDQIPAQHREFFAQLPWLIAGSVDAGGQPWASVLVNPPGFVQAPDAQRLTVRARALPGDPLQQTLRPGAALGLLGIEPQTRRRNRLNGIVETSSDEGFTLRVQQSFGNCPKYITQRQPTPLQRGGEHRLHRSDSLDAAAERLIRGADTFFIATAFSNADGGRSHGVDVSHRGGPPGFVRIDDAQSLTVPDFIGNFFFNTLGNLLVNPRAGLLFIDFVRGDLLYLAVEARIVWDGPEVDAVEGAERLMRFRLREALRVEGSLPLAWSERAAEAMR